MLIAILIKITDSSTNSVIFENSTIESNTHHSIADIRALNHPWIIAKAEGIDDTLLHKYPIHISKGKIRITDSKISLQE